MTLKPHKLLCMLGFHQPASLWAKIKFPHGPSILDFSFTEHCFWYCAHCDLPLYGTGDRHVHVIR